VAATVGGCGDSEEPGGAGGAAATTAPPASTAGAPTTGEPATLADGRHPVYLKTVDPGQQTITKDVSVTLAELASYFPNSGTAPSWITVDQGQVTKIAQQFLP
jgi:hypothetical protein